MTAADALEALLAAGGELLVDGDDLRVRVRRGTPPEVRENVLAHSPALWWLWSGGGLSEVQTWQGWRRRAWEARGHERVARGQPPERAWPLAYLEVAPWSEETGDVYEERVSIVRFGGGASEAEAAAVAFLDAMRHAAEFQPAETPPPAELSGAVPSLPGDTAGDDPAALDLAAGGWAA